ncbi:MAG: nucleotidyltransferase family protein [Microbacter sp.]
MKAMIVAAGLGTRLQPLTNEIPKALVPLNGKPLLQGVCEKLIKAGFNEIIINVHHFPDQIIQFVHQHDDFNIRIAFSDERNQLLDTGGAIKKAAWFFDDQLPFLIHNVDVVSDIDLKAFYDEHSARHADALLLVNQRTTHRHLWFDESGQLKAWSNDTTKAFKSSFDEVDLTRCQPLAFGGIHIMSPSLLEEMSQWEPTFSIIDFYLSTAKHRRIVGYPNNNMTWFDVGTIDKLKTAEAWIIEQQKNITP